MVNDTTLLIFAKAPIPGTVKTRLAPVLNPGQCAGLHAALCLRTVRVAVNSGISRIEMWCQPHSDHPYFQFLVRRFAISLAIQQGQGLGERMDYAFRQALLRTRTAIAIGCDCYKLDADYLKQAVDILRHKPAVVGPAQDGGYVLLGLGQTTPELFTGIAWGSTQVLEQTRSRLQAAGTDWSELPTLQDLDRPEDLMHYRQARLKAIPSGWRFATP